jgi:hypothetical protein
MDGTANGQVPGCTNDNAWPAPLLPCVYPLTGRLIRELVDLLPVYLDHEPARVSDSRIRRRVAVAAVSLLQTVTQGWDRYHHHCHISDSSLFSFNPLSSFWNPTSP